MLLLRSGYEFAQYVSFETIIEQRKGDYYRALMAGQQYRGTDNEVVSEWMLFFLSCLETLVSRLEAKYSLYQQKGGYLNERQEQPAKISGLAKHLPDHSINTLKKDLQYLVQQGFVKKIGVSKATVYILREQSAT